MIGWKDRMMIDTCVSIDFQEGDEWMDNLLIARGGSWQGRHSRRQRRCRNLANKGREAATCKAIERADKQRTIRVGENTWGGEEVEMEVRDDGLSLPRLSLRLD